MHGVRFYHGIFKSKFVFVRCFPCMRLFLFVFYDGKNTFCEIASASHRGVLLATGRAVEQITKT